MPFCFRPNIIVIGGILATTTFGIAQEKLAFQYSRILPGNHNTCQENIKQPQSEIVVQLTNIDATTAAAKLAIHLRNNRVVIIPHEPSKSVIIRSRTDAAKRAEDFLIELDRDMVLECHTVSPKHLSAIEIVKILRAKFANDRTILFAADSKNNRVFLSGARLTIREAKQILRQIDRPVQKG